MSTVSRRQSPRTKCLEDVELPFDREIGCNEDIATKQHDGHYGRTFEYDCQAVNMARRVLCLLFLSAANVFALQWQPHTDSTPHGVSAEKDDGLHGEKKDKGSTKGLSQADTYMNEEQLNEPAADAPSSSRKKSIEGWPEECALYLAPSTIPNGGYGVFTATDLPKGVQIASGDVAIPFIDINWHNQGDYKHKDYHFLYRNYIWSGKSMRMRDLAEHVGVISAGAGALLNSHQGLLNVDEGLPRYGSAGLHRSRDVGAGAISPYYDRKATTIDSVPAGAELFVDYGPEYFSSRRKWRHVPLKQDYEEAYKFLMNFDEVYKDHLSGSDNSTAANITKEEFWSNMRHQFVASNMKRVANALPETLHDAELAIEKGGLKHILQEIKSPEWFKKNGKCIDNIRPQPSTIAQAGRGAIATRVISKGDIVISAPLIHIPRGRDIFKMYAQNKTDENGDYVRGDSESAIHVGYQLMMNYAFGHPESSMLLTPYGPGAAMINHNYARANVRLQWSDPNHEWYYKPIEWLEKDDLAGAQLMLDFVATKDIEPGEEVFLDYGESWQKAWDNFVQSCSLPEDSKDWVSASEMNKVADESYKILRTTKEQQIDPYPSNVEMWCYYNIPLLTEGSPVTASWEPSEAMPRNHPCEIVSREDNGESTSYTINFLEQKSHLGGYGNKKKLPGIPKGCSLTVSGMPREAIKFVDQRYSSDIFLPGAFRHEIVVPDNIWPEAWKNLPSAELR